MTVTRDTYPNALDALTTGARAILMLADTVDLDEMRRICGELETIAPIVDPTAYTRGGMTNLADQAAFLAAVDQFVTDLKKLDRTGTRTP